MPKYLLKTTSVCIDEFVIYELSIDDILYSESNLRCKDKLPTGNLSNICNLCERKELIDATTFSTKVEKL